MKPGNFYAVSTGKSTSITIGGEISLSGPVSKVINAKLGFSVSKSKSISNAVGCVNNFADHRDHGVWWQEKMGWAWVRVDTVIDYEGW